MQTKNMWYTDLMSKFFMIFSLEVIFVSVMGALQGNNAMPYSSLYLLGDKGIAFETLFQLGFNSLLITILVSIFFSDRFFQNMMIFTRTVLMLLCTILIIIFCIIVFDWFPVNYIPGWIGFFISFGICFTGSTGIMLCKTRAESKKYEELLEHYKEQQEKEETKK